MSIRLTFLLIVILTLFARVSYADMGSVWLDSKAAHVNESAQTAIILHNTNEEILILGTELRADKKTPIVRFIPFPSEPEVSLAPPEVFKKLTAIVAKYGLSFQYVSVSKGAASGTTEGVDVRLSTRLGAHDLTVIKVKDAGAFRSWVNDYFMARGVKTQQAYPDAEAIVSDYITRGMNYFALDYVEVAADNRMIDPVVYRFKSKDLYYPLRTSNTFGGRGTVELFLIAPTTLCVPAVDRAATPDYRPEKIPAWRDETLGGSCLNFPGFGDVDHYQSRIYPSLRSSLKASTSAQLIPEEGDLEALYPGGEEFFHRQPVFLQAVRYGGEYDFTRDIFASLSQGTPMALDGERFQYEGFSRKYIGIGCDVGGGIGQCKGHLERYFYDRATHTCQPFLWGGCSQGPRPFQTKAGCEKMCWYLQ